MHLLTETEHEHLFVFVQKGLNTSFLVAICEILTPFSSLK